MSSTPADIIARLQKEILPLQGFKPAGSNLAADPGLGRINNAFPNNVFPLGAVHEFLTTRREDIAATAGFIAGMLAALMRSGGACFWIGPAPVIFPPALSLFGIDPHKIIFIHLPEEKDLLWTMEEALRCDGLAAVVGEIREMSLTASRRLQLAVEQSRVTGLLIRHSAGNRTASACVARWRITPVASALPEAMPGVGFPRWNAELLKVRNGKPGAWQLEWAAGKFRHVSKLAVLPQAQQKQTG